MPYDLHKLFPWSFHYVTNVFYFSVLHSKHTEILITYALIMQIGFIKIWHKSPSGNCYIKDYCVNNYLHIAQSFFRAVTVSQFKKFPAFSGTSGIIIVHTRTRHLTQPSASWIQLKPANLFSLLRFVLLFSSHLRLCLPSLSAKNSYPITVYLMNTVYMCHPFH
jgi:hypothetical protein